MWWGEYLEFLDLLLELCDEVLFVLQPGGQAVDLHIFPAKRHAVIVSYDNENKVDNSGGMKLMVHRSFISQCREGNLLLLALLNG